jgi:hypothetical protein
MASEDREYLKLLRGASEAQAIIWDAIREKKTGWIRLNVRVEEGAVRAVRVGMDMEPDLGVS